MEIGIIGKGKMGMDLLLYLLNYECKLVLICRKADDVDAVNKEIDKVLNRKKKRGVLSESEYEKRRQECVVSATYESLKDCSLVIETVIEDLSVKQDVLSKVEEIVSDTCILASNTSSLDLNSVFEKCHIKNRCMGIHFFYPIKCTSYVEIGLLKDTQPKYVDEAANTLKNMDKEALVAEDDGCLALTKIINTIVSFSYLIYQEGKLSIRQLDSLIKNQVMMFGPFEIVDSTGLFIILTCMNSFLTDRYHYLYQNFHAKILQAYQSGYAGGTSGKGLIIFEEEHNDIVNKLSESELKIYEEKCVNRFQAVLLNEVAHLLNSNAITDIKLPTVVKEILGLRKSLIEMYDEMGEETLIKTLSEDFHTYNIELFKQENYSIYEKSLY